MGFSNIKNENTILEVYINGVVSARLQFKNVPLQNYYDVHIGKNEGFNGKISNLQYHSEALSIFNINNLVSSGTRFKNFFFKNTFIKKF